MTPTIYFDTSFYVALARATDEDAANVLQALDAAGVRVVISVTLMRELLSSVDRPNRDRLLHARIASLQHAPYLTAPDLTWTALLVSGDSRRGIANALAGIDEALIPAESAAVLANTTYSHGMKREATAHTMATMPFMSADGTIDLTRFGEFIEAVVAPLEIEVPKPLTPERVPDLLAALSARLPPDALEGLATLGRLTSSAVATDNRPYETIVGRASGKARERLAHTYRDARHMAEFVQHADVIHAFQLDGPQYGLLERDKEHELRRLGVHRRCFAASTLGEAVARALDILAAHSTSRFAADDAQPAESTGVLQGRGGD